MELREYQRDALEQIRCLYSRGVKRVLLHLATGAGKTVVFSEAMKGSSARNKKSIMVVRGRELVEQASQRLFREKVEHGVRMARHWNRNYGAPVQVCSIDTLIARDDFPPADLVVIDEVDQATSDGYRKLSEYYAGAFFLGVTATPYTTKSLRHIAQEIVQPITMLQLIDQGFLVAPRCYAPSAPDLSGVRIEKSEYNNFQLAERMGTLTGDIVAHWKALGGGRPTLCFAVNINHSHALRDLFISQGIEAEHCDADTPDFCRKAAIKRLENGSTKVLCNVGIFGRGVDIPFLGCIIMARPTRSYNLYIQQAGRGTRTHNDKEDFILLDHAGNIGRHGFITVEPPADLDGNKHKKKELLQDVRICRQCYLAYAGKHCPDCGPMAADPKERVVEVEEGRLAEIRMKEGDPILQFLVHAKKLARQRGYKQGWIYHQLVKRFGPQLAAPHLPKWFVGGHDVNPFLGSPYKPIGSR